ncbi:GntR family transcriptional regulator [Bombilactobacillus bombi]|uniref:GntR family transcriptional regulator n=1 Tax=Bombilactobacillus bombi TaxID=1303590 RepID=UPI0015E61CDA|nr:GntR family transcriptional regulator [Bombilactobacillus bombi]MBA1434956.1 GntR family transcriptional regulator [Bombilactobacillus bombi]
MPTKLRTKYETVMMDLREKIVTGKYQVDSKLPSEEELKQIYSVSRITIRQAVDGLVSDGIIEKVQGKGSYVRKPTQVRRLLRSSSIESFSKTAEENGFEPKMKILKIEKLKVNREIKRGLKTSSSFALHTVRLCYLDDDPVVIESNFFPLPKFEKLPKYDLNGSLYKIFHDDFGIESLTDSNSILRVIAANKEQARLLKRSVGFPLFNLRNQIYDNNHNLVQYGIELIATDRYEFRV